MIEKPVSVIIPTLDAAATLRDMLHSVRAAPEASDIIQNIFVIDGGSSDDTLKIARDNGVQLFRAARGRASQMGAGAGKAKSAWLLFLHADTRLAPRWAEEVAAFIKKYESAALTPDAPIAAFRFRIESPRFAARILEAMVALRCAIFRAPYGDQGLLISKSLYERLGGFPRIALMEDIALVRRVRRGKRIILKSAILTSDRRYERGYLRRVLKNQLCLALYALHVPPERIREIYEK